MGTVVCTGVLIGGRGAVPITARVTVAVWVERRPDSSICGRGKGCRLLPAVAWRRRMGVLVKIVVDSSGDAI